MTDVASLTRDDNPFGAPCLISVVEGHVQVKFTSFKCLTVVTLCFVTSGLVLVIH